MEAWGATVLGMAVEAGLLGTAMVVAAVVLRPGPSWRAGLMLVGLLQFLIPPLLTVPMSGTDVWIQVAAGPVLVDTAGVFVAVAGAQLAGFVAGTICVVRSLLARHRILGRAERLRSGPVHEILRRAADERGIATPALFLTEDVGPVATGVLRPAVLLPRRLAGSAEARTLQMIFAHEVAHLSRNDPLVGVMRRLTVSLWWFHPVAWVLARTHRTAAEDACDDAAVGGGDPSRYCSAVLAAAVGQTGPRGAGVGLWEHSLARRFRRLHARETVPRSRRARRLAVMVGAAALLAAPFGLPGLPGPNGDGEASSSRHVVEHVYVVERVHPGG